MERDKVYEKEVRVRYAPSPTGIPHVGNIRTALFNYFHAESNNGQFLLRIEDTDQARKIDGAVEAIQESLLWLGVKWSEMSIQSDRVKIYQDYAQKLVEEGKAKEEDGAIRFIIPKQEGEISWTDAIGNRNISFDLSEVEDFIILKKDGYPTYHLANVIDDHEMQITHVIRGDDWISSTPKHLLLYKSFNWDPPLFAHVPNVLGENRQKLSKRRGAKSVLDYKGEGIVPEALLNYLMLLGWAPKNDRTIVSIEDINSEFSLANVSVAPAIFNETKLLWMNGEYIRSFDDEELKRRLLEFDPDLKSFDQELVALLIEPAKSRMKTLSDFKILVTPFIEKQDIPNSEIRQKLKENLEEISQWNKDEIVDKLKQTVNDNQIKFQDIYEVVIGARQGLPLGDVFALLGREKTLHLLQ